jgi:predicted small secreted protein
MSRRTEVFALARVLAVAALAILVAACNSGGGGAGGY